jgi:hypothetical protein
VVALVDSVRLKEKKMVKRSEALLTIRPPGKKASIAWLVMVIFAICAALCSLRC